MNKFQYQSWLGECSTTIDKVDYVDGGVWICQFARETGTPDEIIEVEVGKAFLQRFNFDNNFINYFYCCFY